MSTPVQYQNGHATTQPWVSVPVAMPTRDASLYELRAVTYVLASLASAMFIALVIWGLVKYVQYQAILHALPYPLGD